MPASVSNFPDLPVNQALPDLQRALSAGHAVLTAPPGSGKTTVAPLALLDQPWLQGKKILMLEPRRPAARMAARRLAQVAGVEPGGLVGYQVRLDRNIGPHTRIEVLTEGILTRRLQSDPELQGVGLVIFDEFHERTLQADLGLTLCLDVCGGLREDLRLLVMSATLDAAPLCELLGAQHVQAAGRQYPVEVRHLPAQDRREPLTALPALVRQALDQTRGDLLVFLPGRGEIERLAEQVSAHCAAHGVVLERLFGDLPAGEQDRILMPQQDRMRRVILSTDLAESSVTIEGVDCVVDSGLSRKPQFDPNSGMTRLQVQAISRASAEQRAGRAGRMRPGLCLRAWSEARHARLRTATPPEISTSDLSGLVLQLALWGVTDPRSLRWLDAPPPAHWQQANALLRQLDAIAGDAAMTPAGRQMAVLGLEPRLARLLAAASNQAEAEVACDLAALLSERDLFSGHAHGVDLAERLQLLQDLRGKKHQPGDVDRRRAQAVLQLSAALQRQLGIPGGRDGTGEVRAAGELLALAFPDRVAQLRRNSRGRYRLANGRGAALDSADRLASQEWLVVANLDAGRREGRIWSALPVSLPALHKALARHIQAKDELYWDETRQGVMARRVSLLGELVLSEQQGVPQDLQAAQALLLEQLGRQWPQGLNWDKAAWQLRERMQCMRSLQPDQAWPDTSDNSLRDNLPSWLGPWLGERLRMAQLGELDLVECLKGMLTWEQQQLLDTWLPVYYTTPAGSRRRVDYAVVGQPRVAVPLQEMFGQAVTPTLAGGRLALVMELLNPAGRPIQTTSELAGFWGGSYAEVRKELRGRYPKHDWPEDPAQAPPRRGTGRPKR